MVYAQRQIENSRDRGGRRQQDGQQRYGKEDRSARKPAATCRTYASARSGGSRAVRKQRQGGRPPTTCHAPARGATTSGLAGPATTCRTRRPPATCRAPSRTESKGRRWSSTTCLSPAADQRQRQQQEGQKEAEAEVQTLQFINSHYNIDYTIDGVTKSEDYMITHLWCNV